jgi:cytochrome P450
MGYATELIESPLLRRRPPASVPAIDVDLYADDVVEDSTAAFQRIRDAGPVVRLPRNRLWAMGRFEDVRAALRDDELFASDRGVAANPIGNLSGRKSILFSNGQTHATRRSVMMRPLGAKALAPVADRLDAEADAIVEGLVGAPEFDAVREFSSALPLRVVAELVGLPVPAERLCAWSTMAFDALGPLNGRWRRALPGTLNLIAYVQRLDRSRVTPGSWAAAIFDAADRGEIGKVEARMMIIDFIAPSLDTTVHSISHMLWLLGRNPDAWQRLRREPELIPAAVVEAVRIASPVRCFTRRVSRNAELGGIHLRAGDRVALLFAAANMDERRFPDPARFDLDRPPGGNLGWGNGPHTCIGIHLAKLEMQALLRALVARVETIETVADPSRIRNNTVQGIASLPARLG